MKAPKLLPAFATRAVKAMFRGVTQLPARAASFFSVLQETVKNVTAPSSPRATIAPQTPAVTAPWLKGAKPKRMPAEPATAEAPTQKPVERRKSGVNTVAEVVTAGITLAAPAPSSSVPLKANVTESRRSVSRQHNVQPTAQGKTHTAAFTQPAVTSGAERPTPPKQRQWEIAQNSQRDPAPLARAADNPRHATVGAEPIAQKPVRPTTRTATVDTSAPTAGKLVPQSSGTNQIQPLAALRTDRLGGADSRMPQAEFIHRGATAVASAPATASAPRSDRPAADKKPAPMDARTAVNTARAASFTAVETPARADRQSPAVKPAAADHTAPIERVALVDRHMPDAKLLRTDKSAPVDRQVPDVKSFRTELPSPVEKPAMTDQSAPPVKAPLADNPPIHQQPPLVTRSFWGLNVSPQPAPVQPMTATPIPAAEKSLEPVIVATAEPVKADAQTNSKPRPGANSKVQSPAAEPVGSKPGMHKLASVSEFALPLPESPLKKAVTPVAETKAHPVDLASQVKLGDPPPQKAPVAEAHKATVPEKAASAETRSDSAASAVSVETAPAHESQLPTAESAPLRPRYSPEQIRELQSLAAKAINSARMSRPGEGEAAFQWRHDELGVLNFRIVTHHADVSVEISSSRSDVAQALNEGRGVMERMITDVGLRIERFDVHVRGESSAPEMQHEPRNLAQRHRQAEQDSTAAAGGEDDRSAEKPAVEISVRRSPLAEREWVA